MVLPCCDDADCWPTSYQHLSPRLVVAMYSLWFLVFTGEDPSDSLTYWIMYTIAQCVVLSIDPASVVNDMICRMTCFILYLKGHAQVWNHKKIGDFILA